MQEPRADGYTPLKRLTKIRAGRHVEMFTRVRWCSLTFVDVHWRSLTFVEPLRNNHHGNHELTASPKRAANEKRAAASYVGLRFD
jgi:hypothetical protein